MNTTNRESAESSSAIVAKIKTGQIAPRSRWYFVLRAILFGLGAAILFVSLLFFVSFVVFVLRASGLTGASSFGFRGAGLLLASLPWFLVAVSLVFLIVLEVLVRRYAFAYRRPLLLTLGGIFLFAIVGGFLAEQAGMHRAMLRFADERHLPGASPFYHRYVDEHHERVRPGTIILLTGDGFFLRDPRDEEIRVIVTRDTRITPGTTIAEDEFVVVFGDTEPSSTIRAFGIKRFDPNKSPFPPHRGIDGGSGVRQHLLMHTATPVPR